MPPRGTRSPYAGLGAREEKRGRGASVSIHRWESAITFETAALVAVLDLVIYVALPEGERFGPLAQRMPRVAWSVLTIFFSTLTGAGTQPWLALILGLLLASSAVTDLLWWLPYYAFTGEWEKCLGGFFTKRVCK